MHAQPEIHLDDPPSPPQGSNAKSPQSNYDVLKMIKTSVNPVDTELYILYTDDGRPKVEVSGYVMILSASVQHVSIFGNKTSQGNSSRTPAEAITYSQQWLCEQWEDVVCVRCHESHACMYKISFLSHIPFLCVSHLNAPSVFRNALF